ncbi:pheromone-regulated protein prm10 [Basidiobolus ranarum]|uniref:Pheromone-regulated protein prm10 n=1 Tax=Basidiobolus ranarum TaxID=34480 RepID=A0ABR2VW40_9FUNG
MTGLKFSEPKRTHECEPLLPTAGNSKRYGPLSADDDIPTMGKIIPLRRNKTMIEKNKQANNLIDKFTGIAIEGESTTGGVLFNLLKFNTKRNTAAKAKKHFPPSLNDGRDQIEDISCSSDEDTITEKQLEARAEATAFIADILLRQDYLILLSKAMVVLGSPAHRLDDNMSRASAALNVQSSFAFLPGVIMISYGDEQTHTSETHIIKVDRGYNMYKLDQVNTISKHVIYGHIKVEDAYEALEKVMDSEDLYSWWCDILVFGASSFLIAPLAFQGNWGEAFVSGILGTLIGILNQISKKLFNYANVFEISAAVITSVVATGLRHQICYQSVIMSSVSMLLPGLGLTTSVMELASRNLISGVVRLVYSLVVAFMLGFGLSFGSQMWRAIDKDKSDGMECLPPLPEYWTFILLPATSILYCINLQAHARQWPMMISLSCTGFAISQYSSQVLDPTASAAFSSFCLGLLGNIYSRITHAPGFAATLCGVMLLVPGGLGVRAVYESFGQNGNGTALAFEMIVIALSISVGLFVSTLLVYPTGKRRTALLTF